MSFWDRFEVCEDYPKSVAENALPQSTHYRYISSTFLDGIVNYVDIKEIYVLPLYNSELPTEEELREVFSEHHTQLRKVGDIVVLFAETINSFWIFVYDPDVSDCSVGRCVKGGSFGSFIQEYIDFIRKNDKVEALRVEFSTSGWISW